MLGFDHRNAEPGSDEDMARIVRLIENGGFPLRKTAGEAPHDLHAKLQALVAAHKTRRQVYGDQWFVNPAWEMTLDLGEAVFSKRQVSVSSICLAASCPPTTALRHLGRLVRAGLVERRNDPEDGRRVFTALTDKGRAMLWLCLAQYP